jgi:hypothetical protein
MVVPTGKHDLKGSLECTAWLLEATAALKMRKKLVIINCAGQLNTTTRSAINRQGTARPQAT